MSRLTDYIPIAEVPFHCPMTMGRHPHLDTVKRWAKLGVKGRKLPRTAFAGRWFVEKSALDEFLVAIGRKEPSSN